MFMLWVCTHSNFYVKTESVVKSFHRKQLWTNMNLFIKDQLFSALTVEMDFCLTINCKTMPIHMQILSLNAPILGVANYTRVKVNTGGMKSTSDSLSGICMYHLWQKFTKKKYGDEHLAIHSKELENECPKCGKKYSWH